MHHQQTHIGIAETRSTTVVTQLNYRQKEIAVSLINLVTHQSILVILVTDQLNAQIIFL